MLVDTHDVHSVPTLVSFEDGEGVARLAKRFQGAASVVASLDEHTEDVPVCLDAAPRATSNPHRFHLAGDTPEP